MYTKWSVTIIVLSCRRNRVYVWYTGCALRFPGGTDKLKGFVFGRCTDCKPDNSYGSLTLEQVLTEHIEPLGIPAFSGSMIGHIKQQFTIPLGIDVEIDADAGSIRMLEAGVI
jgi:muramoyltetrapeptide carboxypeptidase